jgi:cytochrome oxidase Cu insertion factor (SCO1/SenC/PrrC family)
MTRERNSMNAVNDSRWIAAMLITAWVALAAGASPAQANPFDLNVTPLEIGDRMPDVAFVDQHGHPFRFSSTQGEAVVVGFIYTRCDDACPIITQKFGQLDRVLGKGPYRLIEVTIDPSHDTPAVIAGYAKKFGIASPRWQVVTGNPAAVTTFARSAGLSVVDNGKGELVHNARLLVVGPDGRLSDIVELIAWEPSKVAAQLEHVAGLSSNPLARADFALTKTVAQFCGGSYQVASGLIDVVAGALVIVGGIMVMLWLRRRLFAQGA